MSKGIRLLIKILLIIALFLLVFSGCANYRLSFYYESEPTPFAYDPAINIHGQDRFLTPDQSGLKLNYGPVYLPKEAFDNTLPKLREPEVYSPPLRLRNLPPPTYPGPYDRGNYQPTYPVPVLPRLNNKPLKAPRRE